MTSAARDLGIDYSQRSRMALAANHLRQLLSPLFDVNEHNFHAALTHYPELFTAIDGSVPVLAIDHEAVLIAPMRKTVEVSLPDPSRRRADFLVFCYGCNQYDVVECKWQNEPFIGNLGTVTKYLWDSIVQGEDYRQRVMHGRAGAAASQARPRLIVIGASSHKLGSGEDEQEILDAALHDSKWAGEVSSGLLFVTTWRALARKADRVERGSSNSLTSASHNWTVLALHEIARKEGRWPSAMSLSARLKEFLPFLPADLLDGISQRAGIILSTLHRYGLAERTFPGEATPHINALLQVVGLILYQDDGDIQCAPWDHASTYMIGDILKGSRDLTKAVAPKLIRIMSLDTSEDLIGRAAHLARSLPDISDLRNDDVFSRRWQFPCTKELTEKDGRKRRWLPSWIQVGYLLALHGDSDAITFMNEAAGNGALVDDLATWHLQHARRNTEKFVNSLREKAMSEQANMLTFRRWHQRVFETSRVCLIALTRKRPQRVKSEEIGGCAGMSV